MPDILSLKKGDYLVWRDKDLNVLDGKITNGMVGKIVMSSPNKLADEARAQGLYTSAGPWVLVEFENALEAVLQEGYEVEKVEKV